MKDYTELGLEAIDQARSLTIEDQQDYEVAQAMGKAFSNIVKEIKAYFKPMKADAKKSHQNIVDAEKHSLADPEKATAILKTSMLKYEQKLESLRREEETRLRQELAARQKEERGKAEKDGLEIEPPEITPEDITVAPTIQKQGSTRANWKAEVTDKTLFIAWVVSNDATYSYLEPNMKMLTEDAKRKKGPSDIGGVRFYNDPIKVF